MLIDTQYNYSSVDCNNPSFLTEYSPGYMVGIMKYGERLQKARIYADLTQQQLAERIHNACTQVNISKLERGNASGSEFTVQFANALGVRPMWLAEEDGEMLPDVYTTSDPTLGEILKVLEPRADYFKETALKTVLSTIDLVDHVQTQEKPPPRETAKPDHEQQAPPDVVKVTVNVAERRRAMANKHKPLPFADRRKKDAS